MKGYIDNIEKVTIENENFRRVLYTGKYSQLVIMSLLPGEEIGAEVHDTVDQFIRVDAGNGKVVIDGKETEIGDGFAVIIPAGSEHNVINTGEEKMKLYTIYSPAEHKDGTIHVTKDDAIADHDNDHFNGVTTE